MRTKQISIIIVALFSVIELIQAQFCPDPTQSASSSFDWTLNSWEVWVRITDQALVQRTIPSPFHRDPDEYDAMPNTGHLEVGTEGELTVADYHPDDGWVLVVERMGFNSNTAGRFPQFVLYNRFESKLRYFIF